MTVGPDHVVFLAEDFADAPPDLGAGGNHAAGLAVSPEWSEAQELCGERDVGFDGLGGLSITSWTPTAAAR